MADQSNSQLDTRSIAPGIEKLCCSCKQEHITNHARIAIAFCDFADHRISKVPYNTSVFRG